MTSPEVTQIRKRDHSVVPFEPEKIRTAISKALAASNTGDGRLARDLAEQAVRIVEARFAGNMPTVEDVQDIVEEILMARGYSAVAKAYILYRKQRTDVREFKKRIGIRDDLKLSVNAARVLEQRYLLKDDSGRILETPSQLFRRVARAVADAERNFDPAADVKALEEEFYSLMSNLEFLPNSPTLMNAGTTLGQLSACFVLPVEDSIVDIFEALRNMALIHQSGGGTGFSFSHLRPKGDVVRSTKGIASGPVSFMRIFDTATEVIKQGGRRRGANMGILRADHPDIMEFVQSKNDGAVLRNFNISVSVTDRFMQAVASRESQPLINPRTGRESGSIQADTLFDAITNQAWRTGDPGMLFLDRIASDNPTPQIGQMEATNPCGELPLLPYESCNLGSINLSRMVTDGKIDREKLGRLVSIAVRFLDDVIEATKFPIAEIEKITRGNRKIGLGVMGFADALTRLGIPYDSEEALEMAESIMSFIHAEAYRASQDLAIERGPFPNFEGSIHDQPGKPRLRNASVLSVAPTGTISILAGCSSGIEPIFALSFVRNVMEGAQLLEANPLFEQVARDGGFYSQELMERVAERGTVKDIDEIPAEIRRVFVTDWDIAPHWHVRMQAAFQKHVDNSVSKTVNLPAEATVEDVSQVYSLAHQLGCKGITVYRYGTKRDQVLNLAGGKRKEPREAPHFLTAESEYSGGCPSGTCPF
ncbi:MAG: adenosylcobalamin-dependent ribonucleoside-diphosphate reductase [Dehalococcoidia bacterium]